ncbi:transmembrane sensor/regulator PpyR [Pseudomonas alcaligenes]|uniref:Transmembrane sensor/regulator PpyR n=1 Tax=Aquipseudomonas alcaligenes TaxID=43263 RepID=A0ABR7S1R1_AQUAC|nr:transmembrane sensor/regulator PpyR [Pseudomonas alcaligenes]MBC9250652.1 transmembrane sensor/regulator PpyR [Pseudomonas alcaligenes]
MIDYIRQPRNLLHLSSLTLTAGLAMLLVGIALAYVLDLQLSIVELVGAHALTILGPTAIKIGYVMRLLAAYQLRRATPAECAHAAF